MAIWFILLFCIIVHNGMESIKQSEHLIGKYVEGSSHRLIGNPLLTLAWMDRGNPLRLVDAITEVRTRHQVNSIPASTSLFSSKLMMQKSGGNCHQKAYENKNSHTPKRLTVAVLSLCTYVCLLT
jgi:hypothetical protein